MENKTCNRFFKTVIFFTSILKTVDLKVLQGKVFLLIYWKKYFRSCFIFD